MRKVIALVGPTASGKSGIAKEIISKFPNIEAVSIDSRQVFKSLDLGTGKDLTFYQHLIDIKKPGENISVVEFQGLALEVIEKLLLCNKIPLLVGGSNYYMDSIIYKREFPIIKTDNSLQQKLSLKSLAGLNEMLLKIDPERAKNIDKSNKRKLLRALEINILTNNNTLKKEKVMSKIYRYHTLILGVDVDRDKLYENIDRRVDERIKEGMIKEVRDLISNGVSKMWLKNLGLEYQIISEYLEAKYSKDEMIKLLKFRIPAFVRRQLTWLRANKDIVWVSNASDASKKVEQFML